MKVRQAKQDIDQALVIEGAYIGLAHERERCADLVRLWIPRIMASNNPRLEYTRLLGDIYNNVSK